MDTSSQPAAQPDQPAELPPRPGDSWLDLPVARSTTFRDLAPAARGHYLRARAESQR